MELTITTPQLLLPLFMCYHRSSAEWMVVQSILALFGGLFRKLFAQVKAFHLIVVLLCPHFSLSRCQPCLMNGLLKATEYACGSCGDDRGIGLKDPSIDTASWGCTESTSVDLHSFCFPSTLPGFLSKQQKLKTTNSEFSRGHSDSFPSAGSTDASSRANSRSVSSNCGIFQLVNDRTVTCFLDSSEGLDELSSILNDNTNQNSISSCRGPLLCQGSASFRLEKNPDMVKSTPLEFSPSPNVEISPAALDWGKRHLYVPSVAFMTVANMHSNIILHVFEPFSTNTQFYPCNFSDILLQPGEVASICFVFLPRWLGMCSGHLILQTSSGGFLVQVKGYAVESPYEINPLLSMYILPSGRLSRNLSLFNPFDETLYVKEVSAWVLVSQGNISHHTEVTCSIDNFQESDKFRNASFRNWLAVESAQVGLTLMALRPHVKWEIGPRSIGIIMEMDFAFELEGKIVGAFCLQLRRSSVEKADIVMVPFEVDLFRKVDVAESVSVSFEAVVLRDGGNSFFVAVSLRNEAPHLLSIVKISQVAEVEIFQVNYIQGLLLFPGSITQVATVSCTQILVPLHDNPPEVSSMNKNCKLVVLTNDSRSPLIEISCMEVVRICFSHENDFRFDHKTENTESGSGRIGSWGSNMQMSSLNRESKAAEADELLLGNWRSQGTTKASSVLDDHEMLFPKVQVGTNCSKWITVKNPSEQPVVMQLNLNAGEIIDECRDTDSPMKPSSGVMIDSEFSTQAEYGFSIAEGAQTEACVHPNGKASLGPILFHPSNRCRWRSSALIRNNLSGVERLSLRGFGGSLSLVLLEGSEAVHSIDFDLNLSIPLNMSTLDRIFSMEEIAYTCSLPLSKELYAKNLGDMPLEVKSIDVSGTHCGLDGFTVDSRQGFSLAPGESLKILISYRTDFSSATVHRDIELAFTSGVLVIPIKAAFPPYTFNICKNSVFWIRLKRVSAAVILAACLMFLVLCCLFPPLIIFVSRDYKSEKSCTVRKSRKSSHMLHKQRGNKFSMSSGAYNSLRTVGEEKTSELSVGGYPDSEDSAPKQGLTVGTSTSVPENNNQVDVFPFSEKGNEVSSILPKSVPIKDSDVLDTCQPCNLTVKTGKEKGKRRRRRKGVSAGLAGLLEVSSSQSGNSTPSSPLSPSLSTSANRAWSPPSDIEARNPFPQASDQVGKVTPSQPVFTSATVVSKASLSNDGFLASQQQPSVTGKAAGSSSLSPFTASPASNSPPSLPCPSLRSTSAVAPHSRAPGSKFYNQKNAEENGGDEYRYDIWGDHFSGLHLLGGSVVKTVAVSNSSGSFFVRGPQDLKTKMLPNSANCSQQES